MVAIFISVEKPVDNPVHMLIIVEKHVNMWITYGEKLALSRGKLKNISQNIIFLHIIPVISNVNCG